MSSSLHAKGRPRWTTIARHVECYKVNFSEEDIDNERGRYLKGSNMSKWDCLFIRSVLKDLNEKMVFEGES